MRYFSFTGCHICLSISRGFQRALLKYTHNSKQLTQPKPARQYSHTDIKKSDASFLFSFSSVSQSCSSCQQMDFLLKEPQWVFPLTTIVAKLSLTLYLILRNHSFAASLFNLLNQSLWMISIVGFAIAKGTFSFHNVDKTCVHTHSLVVWLSQRARKINNLQYLLVV